MPKAGEPAMGNGHRSTERGHRKAIGRPLGETSSASRGPNGSFRRGLSLLPGRERYRPRFVSFDDARTADVGAPWAAPPLPANRGVNSAFTGPPILDTLAIVIAS